MSFLVVLYLLSFVVGFILIAAAVMIKTGTSWLSPGFLLPLLGGVLLLVHVAVLFSIHHFGYPPKLNF